MALFGWLGTPDVARLKRRGRVRPLIRLLRPRTAPALRSEAARALGELGDLRAVEPLAAALPDSEVRAAAATALGALGDARAVRPLLDALRSWPVPDPALDALDRIGWKPAADDDGARYLVLRGRWEEIAEMGTPAVPALLAAIGEDRAVEEEAAGALERIGWKPEATAIGARFLVLRRRWTECPALGGAAAGPLLAELEESVFREDIAEALVAIGEPAVEPLVVALRSGRSHVREVAARCLGAVGSRDAVRSLCAALQDGSADVRRAAVDALGRLGDETAVAALETALRTVGPPAAEALGRIQGGRAVEALVGALGGEATPLRVAAVKALGAVGDPRGAAPLVPLLRDRLPVVRLQTAIALGRIGTRTGVDELAAALHEDPDPDVRTAAARALGHIGDPRSVAPLIGAMTGFFHDWVRRAAAEALAEIAAGVPDGPARADIWENRETIALLGVELPEIAPPAPEVGRAPA